MDTKISKSDLVAKVMESVKDGDIPSKAAADRIVSAVFDNIVNAVADGGEVTIVGFGTFKAVDRAEKEGINPQTHEKIVIPAKHVPKFSAGKAFKDAVAK